MLEIVSAEELLERLWPRAALSHEEAARLLGIKLVDDSGRHALSVPRDRSRLHVAGWRVVRRDVDPDQQLVDGLRVTSPARTIADVARVVPLADAVASADSAVRQGLVGEHELREALGACFGRGCAGPRAVGRLIDPRAESVLESVGRVEFHLEGLRAPQSQYVVRDARGGFVARTDLAWPEAELVVELDGFAFHSDRASAQRDRERTNRLVLLGWRVIRFGWDDVRRRPTWCAAVVREALGLATAA